MDPRDHLNAGWVERSIPSGLDHRIEPTILRTVSPEPRPRSTYNSPRVKLSAACQNELPEKRQIVDITRPNDGARLGKAPFALRAWRDRTASDCRKANCMTGPYLACYTTTGGLQNPVVDGGRKTLRAPDARQRSIVLEALRVQLQDEPLRETQTRKLLRPNPLAPWELRVGQPRVFYEVDVEEAGVVNVLAIGIKRANLLFIAGEEMHL